MFVPLVFVEGIKVVCTPLRPVDIQTFVKVVDEILIKKVSVGAERVRVFAVCDAGKVLGVIGRPQTMDSECLTR